MGAAAERLKAVAATIATIEKQVGKGTIMRLGEKQAVECSVIPSGSLGLDRALGMGGYPRGRLVEIYGAESSGKTTLALHAIAQVQLSGGVAAFIDAEHALDTQYASRLGVNVEELLVSQPDYGEQALEVLDLLIRGGAVDMIVVDSVAALVPKAEIDGDMGDSHMGLQARLMSQAMRKITSQVAKQQATVVFINQTRQKIGVFFGNPETTTGGNALKFYASVRLEIRRLAAIKQGEQVVGNRTQVKVVKNKLAPPFRAVEFDIRYGSGICRAAELLDLGEQAGVVEKSGSWLSFGEARLGQGREAARDMLLADAALRSALEEKITSVWQQPVN